MPTMAMKSENLPFPIIADAKQELAVQMGMLDSVERDKDGIPLTARVLTAAKKVATPVEWKPGDQVMVIPSLLDEDAKKLFPGGICAKNLPSGKNYLRYTPQPQ